MGSHLGPTLSAATASHCFPFFFSGRKTHDHEQVHTVRRTSSPPSLHTATTTLNDDNNIMHSPSDTQSDYDHFSPMSVSPIPPHEQPSPSPISLDLAEALPVCACEHGRLYARLQQIEESIANDRLAMDCLQLSFKSERTTYDFRIAQINTRISRLAHSIRTEPGSFPDRGQWLDLMMRLYRIESVNDDHTSAMQYTIDTINDTSVSITQCKQALCDLASRLSLLATDTEQALHDMGSFQFSSESPYLLQRVPLRSPAEIANRARRSSFVL